MSSLPQEILDLIIDHLHSDPAALKSCCTISSSWFPRSRKHLFDRVEFRTDESHIERWKEAFPDPSSSPACHTRILSIRGLPAITAADADETGWIHTFYRLVRLDLDTFGYEDNQISLVPLHQLSPVLTSLTLCHSSIPPSEVFGLVCSFPLLEDLALLSCDGRSDVDGWDVPSTSPKFTGTLDLRSMGGIRSVARQLCDLPNGLHFNKIMVGCLNKDFEPTMDLVSRCLDTLESIRLSFYLASEFPTILCLVCALPLRVNTGTSGAPSLDLSKATKLRDVEFRCGKPDIRWITMALQTIESRSLQQITIDLYTPSVRQIGETVSQEWLDLDRLLVQFSTSHSIRPKITNGKCEGGTNLATIVPVLLPELTRRGVVDVAERTQ